MPWDQFAYAPFKPPVQPPPTGEEGPVCLTFDKKWLPFVYACLKATAVAQSYTSDNERAVIEANEMIARAMAFGDCGVSCFDLNFVIDDRGHLMFTCNGEASLDLGLVVGQDGVDGGVGPQGNQGIPGPTGATGATGGAGSRGSDSVFGPPGLNATNDTTAKMACAVSTWVVEFVHLKWLDAMDQIDLMVGVGETIADITAQFVNMLAQFTVFGDEALNIGKEFVEGVVQATVDILEAEDTEEFQEMVRCCLYCLLIEHSGGFGDNELAVKLPWVECVGHLPGILVPSAYALFLKVIALQTYQLEASLAGAADRNCGPCEDCPEINFTYDHGSGPAQGNIGDLVTFTGGAFSVPPSNAQYNIQVHVSPCCHLEYVSSTGYTDIDGVGPNVSWNAVDCNAASHNQFPPADISTFGTKAVSLLGINSVTPFTVTFRIHV